MTNKPLRNLLLLLAASVPFVGGAFWLVPRLVVGPPPSLDEIRALARIGQFDRAQSQLGRYLRAEPDNARANLLMAQVATDRPDPRPSLALDHLRRIRPNTDAKAALIRVWMGKARYQQARYDLAEADWTEALRLNPTVPEAGWALFDLLDLERRIDEAHQLGLRLHEIEPDPRDRVRFLLALARLDVDTPAPGLQIKRFERLVPQVPDNLKLAVTLGLALVHNSRAEEGLTLLRDALRRHPDSPEAWDALLTGLDDAGRPDDLVKEFARLPPPLAADPRFARHEGQAAQAAHDWKRAARCYSRALAHQPYNGVILYRLSRALRFAGDKAESDRVDQVLSTFQTAFKQIRAVVEEAQALKTLGLEPRPELYQRLADLRERMGRLDEARAWHRLVLRDSPNEAVSVAALERLK
jgi:tetratricopeptide (TPR) repeat protein